MTKPDYRDLWSLAGLDTMEGNLDRHVSQRAWAVPTRIELDGERLVYSAESDRGPSSGGSLLEDFLRLVEAPSESTLRYARAHGVLHLCVHDRPPHLIPVALPCFDDRSPRLQESWRICMPQGWEEGNGGWEAVTSWRNYARQARAILNMVANLRLGKPCNPEDILTCNQPDPSKAEKWKKMGVAEPRKKGSRYSKAAEQELAASHRALVANILNSWRWYGNVRPELFWEERNPQISFTGSGLFGALATQLMLAINRSGGLAFCSGCGVPYSAQQPPREGQRNYCPECRERKIPERDAARDYRLRKRDSTTMRTRS